MVHKFTGKQFNLPFDYVVDPENVFLDFPAGCSVTVEYNDHSALFDPPEEEGGPAIGVSRLVLNRDLLAAIVHHFAAVSPHDRTVHVDLHVEGERPPWIEDSHNAFGKEDYCEHCGLNKIHWPKIPLCPARGGK